MRKFLLLGLAFALVVSALMFAPRTGAFKDKSSRLPDKKSGQTKTSFAPRVGRAAYYGVSAPVRELAQAQQRVADPSTVEIKDREEMLEHKREEAESNRKREILGLGHLEDDLFVKNDRNREIMRAMDPNAKTAPDAAIAKVPAANTKGALAPLVMPTPSVNFETISLTDTTALPGQGFLPPDTVGDIGPNHYVQMVNSAFRIYSRTGTPLIPLTSIGAIWSTIPGPCAGDESGDPIVLYDQLADRWLLSQFCTVANPNNHQLIAISQTGDPTGAYYLYDFMMPNNKFNDYPKFGVWSDGYYMTDNQFNQAGTQFLGAGVFAFDRTKMLAGNPAASFIYFDKADGCPAACLFGGMLPADIDGFVPPPAGAPAPVLQFDADEFGATDSLRIFDFHADFATPASSTLVERTGSPLAVAAFDPREVPSGSRNVIPQPAPGVAVDAISDRLMNRLAYRNFGTHESLALNHTVNAAVNPAFRAGVRYYEIRKTSPAAAYTVQEQGTMAGGVGDTENRWMGSTALNAAGSQAVGYSVSSATVFPSIRYAGRLAGDPAGSLGQGEALLVAGTSSQTHSSGRWGDYSALNVDPIDDCTFWYTQEYVTGASAPDNTRWHTRVGAFQFGPCPAIQKGILNGTITSTAGGAPIANAAVAAGPFLRTSNGSGVYSIDPIGSGTYTVTVSAPGYVTANVPGVTITTGNTTTQNVQLTPLNQLDPGTAAITAESCAPGNSALDPGETVTVNLPIVNNGGAGATTSNLVATLLATGGVSSPSGPQNYGAVVQGGGPVTRAFTFTVSQTCGNFVNITLQLQDGATNYGNIVYSLRTGTLGAATPLSVSTGNIATAIPDVSSVDIPIAVAATGVVADVNVKVRLNHTFDGDLTLALVAPDNTVVTLSAQRSNPNDGGDNYGTGNNDCSGTPTIFDDAAANSISTGVPPFTGTFRPESPLSAMNGKTITGSWKLRVSDAAALDTGTVGCVTLDFQKQPVLCCGVVGTPVIASGGAGTITAESIAPANNAPDPGETITANFPLINTGDGNTTNLVATLQNSGGVTPVTPTANYGVVVAGGPAVSRPFTFVTSGACGSTVTATLQLQDGAINLGTVAYTFQLGTNSTATTTFSNATAIVIPATGTGATTGAPATPYPSNITVAGITAPVSKVTVTLKQITHTFPSDIDVLLVGPTGVKFILLSDAIGGTDWTGQTYTFDDGAAALMPSSGTPPATGSFKPTNYGTGDVFPAPAPAGPYLNPATAGTDTLAAFNNLSPNGTWSLYVVDDAGTDIGTFAGGWDLTITTTQSICNTQTCSLTCPANITVPESPAASGGAVVNYPGATPTGACGVLGYDVPSGSTFPVGTTTVHVTGANAATCSFTVTVTPSGSGCTGITCPANITQGNDPNQCGAVVTYPAPTPTGTCGTINCSPASGSFFPVGTTTVNCTSSAGPTCSFTITVNDTQPPSITCPANVVVPAQPGFDGATVNYPAPTVTDNCPGAPAPVCSPASGSFFPTGITTVTCSVGGTSCVNKTITHSSSQAITPLNSVSCNDGVGHTDNHYWRAFNLPSFSITGTFHVSSVDIGIEQATAGAGPAPSHQTKSVTRNRSGSASQPRGNRKGGSAPEQAPTQPITVLLHTNTGGAFPAGTLNFLNSVNINVADQAGTILNVPITADVAAGSELVVEVFTPDGTAAGNLFFIGSNSAPETGPSYLSAPDCGVNSPTTTAALGFPNMHIVMNVNGCEDTTGGASSSCNFTVTVKPPRYWSTVGSAGTTDEDSTALVSHEDFAATLKSGLTGTATVRYNITAVQGISAFCPATQSIVYVRFRNSDNAGTHAQVKFDVHRTNILAGGNDTIFSFNSNGLGAGNVFTSASLSPNIDFDFSNYIYWIEATVFRDQAGQFADLGSIEIFENDGTPCP